MTTSMPSAVFRLALFFSVGLAGCSLYYKDKNKEAPEAMADSASLSFATVQSKVFQKECVACHGSEGNVNLETYSEVIRNLDLIRKTAIDEQTMPKGKRLTDFQISTLRQWIDAGAPEYPRPVDPEITPTITPFPSPLLPTPTPVMSELVPTYASIREHVFVPLCIRCHSPNGSSRRARRFPLDTLEGLLAIAEPIVVAGHPEQSTLIQSVRRSDDEEQRMPPSGDRLTELQIKVIEDWISVGMPPVAK